MTKNCTAFELYNMVLSLFNSENAIHSHSTIGIPEYLYYCMDSALYDQ